MFIATSQLLERCTEKPLEALSVMRLQLENSFLIPGRIGQVDVVNCC